MNRQFSVGDRVKIYDRTRVIVGAVADMASIQGGHVIPVWFKDGRGDYVRDWFHKKQLRRLKKKEKRKAREFLIGFSFSHGYEVEANHKTGLLKDGEAIRVREVIEAPQKEGK